MKRKSSKERISDEAKEEQTDGGALKVKHENMASLDQKMSPGLRMSPGLPTGAGNELKQIKHLQSQKEKLESELQTKNRIIEKLNEDVVNRNDAYSKLKVMYDNIKKDNDQLNSEKEAFLSTAGETALFQKQIEEKDTELAALTKELNQIQESIGKVKQEKDLELLALVSETETLKNLVSKYENEKAQFEQDHEAKISTLQQELQQVM